MDHTDHLGNVLEEIDYEMQQKLHSYLVKRETNYIK